MSAAPSGASDVGFAHVSIRYGAHVAVDDVSAEITAGTVTGVVGPNGCGKSSLLSLLTGYHPAYTGIVTVDGQNIARMPPRERAAHIGVMRQHAGPIPDITVEELIAIGPHPLPAAQLKQAIARVGLEDLAGKPLATLSGGQLQRAHLARSIRHNPSLLVLDEPTNHLDVRHKIVLMELLRELRITVVCALHDLDLAARYCDHLLLLSAGELHAQGPSDEVLSTARVRATFGVETEMITTTDGGKHLVVRAATSHHDEGLSE
ncbi:ABC transporter (iron.B12.siderophore.hemin), ATP-binding component [Leucobacter sp. 7(1)]|uniref:ABC transporter (Iron.B12.siderophore.hemin), ATP-binding component n=1 Tax=Agrococcus casei LMG 22410 TaxID=1255656 RepID=A0A1R4FY29_9MICO|nr:MULTISPECIES: ABC transporter ATP-binding protein [Microbacteriaceae]SJM60900.1 ABC transporter (iron.B12.siderophore.hemin), ATP-binding component [Agrococcus casei LMG 22410]SJN07925.1 ABC transporter (iron.B12.siderophore.hemin), ATP-binding component [Leucobacter sp. 7(1)]